MSPELYTLKHIGSYIDTDMKGLMQTHIYANTHTYTSAVWFPAAVVSKHQQMSGPEIKLREDKRRDLLDVGEAIP